MKKNLTIFLIGVAFLLSFTYRDGGTATVENRMGVDIYVLSKPAKKYKVIDSGKVTVLMDCNEIVNKAVKKAAAEKSDGVIIYWETARYDAIKYEE